MHSSLLAGLSISEVRKGFRPGDFFNYRGSSRSSSATTGALTNKGSLVVGYSYDLALDKKLLDISEITLTCVWAADIGREELHKPHSRALAGMPD